MKATGNINERFTELFNANKNRVYDYSLRMLKDVDAAADLTQEVFIRLYNHLDNQADIVNPPNWLFIIARNLCLNEIRDSKKEVNFENADLNEKLIYQDTNPGHYRLHKALDQLENEHREALILKEYQGFSYDDISKITGNTVSAVRSLLYKARLQLKENYEKLSTGGNQNVL